MFNITFEVGSTDKKSLRVEGGASLLMKAGGSVAADSTNAAIPFSVVPVRKIPNGPDVDVCLFIRASSPRSVAQTIETCAYTVRVENVATPLVEQVFPLAIPLSGTRVVVHGSGFLPSLSATVIYHNRSDVLDETGVTDGERFHSRRVPVEVVFNSSTVVSLDVGPTPWDGFRGTYQTLELDNGNGVVTTCPSLCKAENQIYFQDACPVENEYGSGTNCRSCPDGATCPGGFRAWPEPGHWTPSEASASVRKCAEPSHERCVGGRLSECGPGYGGTLCGQCEENYFHSAGRCLPCDTENKETELFFQVVLPAFALFSVVAFLVGLSSNRVLDVSIVVIVLFQHIIVVGRSVGPSLSEGAASIFNAMQVILFDFNFIRPGCAIGKISFPTFYAVSLFFVAIVFVYFFAFATLFQLRTQQDAKANGFVRDSTWRQWLYNNKAFQPRQHRALVLAYHVTYIHVALQTIQLLNCTTGFDGDGPQLAVEPETRCYEGAHFTAALIAWIVVMPYLVFPPFWFGWVLLRNRDSIGKVEVQHGPPQGGRKTSKAVDVDEPSERNTGEVENQGDEVNGTEPTSVKGDLAYRFDSNWGFFVHDIVERNYWWFRLSVYPISLALAVDAAVSRDDVKMKLCFAFALFLTNSIIVVMLRPMKSGSNHLEAAFGMIKIVFTVALLFLTDESTTAWVILVTAAIILGAAAYLSQLLWHQDLIADTSLSGNSYSYEQENFNAPVPSSSTSTVTFEVGANDEIEMGTILEENALYRATKKQPKGDSKGCESPSSSQSSTTELREAHAPWQSFRDDDGFPYWYNPETDESVWKFPTTTS